MGARAQQYNLERLVGEENAMPWLESRAVKPIEEEPMKPLGVSGTSRLY
jgi:hypothetical protein